MRAVFERSFKKGGSLFPWEKPVFVRNLPTVAHCVYLCGTFAGRPPLKDAQPRLLVPDHVLLPY